MNMLYERHNYLDKNINYLCSREIYEYDMKSAGFNIIKYYKLLSDSKINELEKLHKKKRQIVIGLMLQKDKELSEKLNKGFQNARKMFFEANNLKEEDILSIKKDAIFTLKYCEITGFGNIEFAVKNYYSSYFYLNKMEFYYNPKTGIDVKGFQKNAYLHKDYMLDFIGYFAKLLETADRPIVIKFLKDFIGYYKRKELDIGYYRELNSDSMYKSTIRVFDDTLYFNYIGDYDKIDISYNYINYIVPLLQILI